MNFLPKDIEDIIMCNKYALETAEQYKTVLRDIESIETTTYPYIDERNGIQHAIELGDLRFQYMVASETGKLICVKVKGIDIITHILD